MASNNYIYKMSNAGGMSTVTRYVDMLAGNTTWSPWEPAGAYDALATITVPSGGAATIEFAGIPTGYKHLQIRGIYRPASAASPPYNTFFRVNSDSGSNYSRHFLSGDGASASASGQASQAYGWLPYHLGSNSLANTFNSVVIDVLDYSSISKNKTIRSIGGYDANGSGYIQLVSSAWLSTSAITSYSIFTGNLGSFAQFSSFALYGVK
jgi:hypothetical protein